MVNKLDEAYSLTILSLFLLLKRTGVLILVDFTCHFHFFRVVSWGGAVEEVVVL